MSEKYNLFLDDERFPPDDGREWVVARSVVDAIAWRRRGRMRGLSGRQPAAAGAYKELLLNFDPKDTVR